MTIFTNNDSIISNSLSIRVSRIKLFFGCLLIFAALPFFSYSQENCNNGIDDDGDGLIDCYDLDCAHIGPCAEFFYGYDVHHCNMQPPVGPFGLNLVWESTVNVSTRSVAFVADLDNDGMPEVICHNDGANQLYILDGLTGATEITINCPAINDLANSMVIADTDNDGFGEIYAVANNGNMYCFEHDGTPKAGFVSPNIGQAEATPNIADFDGDGLPEVYIGNLIYHSQTGALIASGGGGSRGLNPAGGNAWHSIAGDVLPAVPGLELICGNTVYAVNIGAGTVTPVPNNLPGNLNDGYTSLVDINMDGILDIVVTSNGTVYVWNAVTGNQIGNTFNIPNTGSGGRPNIADYDNDGQPEIGAGGQNRYVVIDFDIATSTLSQLWITNIVDASQMTTGVAFDFEGDGITDVVYRDENVLYVYDGATGTVKASIPCGSATRTEFPTVADVNADGSANIVCNCSNNNQGGTGRVRAYTSNSTTWVGTRKVMNQHGYHVTNINDDLTVPVNPQNNSLIPQLNNFLAQVPVYDKNWNPVFIPIPDLVVTIDTVETCNNVGLLDVTVTVCNIGSDNVNFFVPISFYNGNPLTGGIHIATGNFNVMPLDTPNCRTQTFPVNWNDTPFTLYAFINDNGTDPPNAPTGIFTECDSLNNFSTYDVVPYEMFPEITGIGAGYCPEGAAVPLTGTPAGGVFSGPGMVGNNFNPATAGSGLHTIVYTYLHGVCPFYDAENILVYESPVVDFNATTVCEETVTNFTDLTTVVNGFATGWNWTFGDLSVPSTDQNPQHIYNNGGIFNATLTVTSDQGCVSSATKPVVVHHNPVADFTATNSCFNEPSTFTDNSTIPSGTITDWIWSFGNGVFAFSQDTIYVYPTAAVYTVGLQVTSDSGCVATHTQSITVSNLPVADFGFNDICENQQAVFTDESYVIGGGLTGWEWDFGDGTTFTGQNPPPHNFPGWGPYFVRLITSSAGGACLDTITQMIGVYPMPTAEFSALPVCFGMQTSFTDLSDIPYGSVLSWTYNFDDNGVITNNRNPIYTFSTHGNFDVNLEVSSDFGCITDTTIQVVVHPVATADFTASSVCFGNATAFTDQSIIPTGNIVAWNWNFNDGVTSTLQNPFHTYQTPGLFNVNLSVTSDSGCVSDTIIEIEVYPVPDVNFTADIIEGCQPLPVQFTDLSVVNPGYVINWWFWDFGDGNSSSLQNPLHVYDTAGVFDVTLQAKTSNGCTVVDTVPAMITVYPKPNAAFYANPSRAEIIYPRIEIVDLSSGADFWNYDFGDSTASALSAPVHLYNDTGTYLITQIVTTNFGCKDTAFYIVVIEPSFTFYIPNAFTPNGDGVNDFFFGTGIGVTGYEMRIFNRWGEQIFASFDENEQWDGTLSSGKLAKQDVYVYTFKVRDMYDEIHVYRGRVTMLIGQPQE